MNNIGEISKDRIILLISHRLAHFPQMDQIIFMNGDSILQGTHEELLQNVTYRKLYEAQQKEGWQDEA